MVFAYDRELSGKEYLLKTVTYKHLTDIGVNEKYIYPVNVVAKQNIYKQYFTIYKDGFKTLPERVINDVRANRAKIVIIFPNEGIWTQKELSILEGWCKDVNFTKEQVYLIHGNHKLVSDNSFTYIPINNFLSWISVPNDVSYKPVDSKDLYLSYNRRWTYSRAALLCELIESNILNRGLISYLNFNYKDKPDMFSHSDYSSRFGLSNLHNSLTILDSIKPIVLDITDVNYNPANSLVLEHYEHTLLTITTETLTTSDTLFFSEKTWKPIAVGHPFMLVSSVGALKELKKLGYKTFDKWWSEEYDNENDVNVRINMIVSELVKLSKFTREQLIVMRNDMKEVLQHNKELFKVQQGKSNLFDTINKIWCSGFLENKI